MSKTRIQKASYSPVPLLKTCQTCFHAKIKCQKAPDNSICDRCLRLNKECVFLPSKRRQNVNSAQACSRTAKPSAQAKHSPDGFLKHASPESSVSPSTRMGDCPYVPDPLPTKLAESESKALPVSHCPYARGLLSYQLGEQLLKLYQDKMFHYFPFVVLPSTSSAQMSASNPCLSLAVLTVASSRHLVLQRRLGHLFNALIASRLIDGNVLSLDLLQALLVYSAWAHYQPRPKKFSQHMGLAISIVSDMRLQSCRAVRIWHLASEDLEVPEADWNFEEMRAMLGCYFLASCSATLLQKMHTFRNTGYINYCSRLLARSGQATTDRFIAKIVLLQKFAEDLDEAMLDDANNPSPASSRVLNIATQFQAFKAELDINLSECPLIACQIHVLELLMQQWALPGSPNKSSTAEDLDAGQASTITSLSTAVSAAKSLINTFLIMPPKEEHYITNIHWLMFTFSLSMAIRCDLLAHDPKNSAAAAHLRPFLDMQHIFRQILLRLEALVSGDVDDSDDRDTFYHYLVRAQNYERLYTSRIGRSSYQAPKSLTVENMSLNESTVPAAGISTTPELFHQLSEQDLMDIHAMDWWLDDSFACNPSTDTIAGF